MITDHEFVGLRQWGIFPSADRPCQHPGCGMPQAQHARMCPAALTSAGKYFRCELVAPHSGSHRNKAAEAIWDGPAA